MGHVELQLIPTAGAKPEFLATVDLVNDNCSPHVFWKLLTEQQKKKILILEGYTRDSWSLDSPKWTQLKVQSIDGRKKLPGFINYLRERKKSCFGRFLVKSSTFVWIISHKQTNSSQLNCRIAPLNTIPNCPLRPKSASKPPTMSTTTATATATATTTTKKKGFGLLGNLVGAQKRTNHQVISAASYKPPGAGMNSKTNRPNENHDPSALHDEQEGLKSSSQILADFRRECNEKFLDFDIAPEDSIKIHIKLSDHSKKVQEADKGSITMEVLQYIVYEQAEEINEEWIEYKEPGEFSDEITITIYKDADMAPPEALEDRNQAELPEEMKVQQNLNQQKRKQQEAKEARIQEMLQRQALRKIATGGDEGSESGFTVLNKEKRDLRTIEEIQQGSKRRKIE